MPSEAGDLKPENRLLFWTAGGGKMVKSSTFKMNLHTSISVGLCSRLQNSSTNIILQHIPEKLSGISIRNIP